MKERSSIMGETLSKALITFSAASLSIILDTAKPFIVAMIVFVLLDYLTGITKGIYLKDLDSKTATKGLLKKLTFFMAAFTGWTIDLFFNIPFSVGTIVSTWIIVTEILSIFENLVDCDIPIPQSIVKYFKRFKDTVGEEVKSDESD
jgi:toxin secretion/phage lysis holin